MKVVFVSNYFNHHQKPFCQRMQQRLGRDFAFISTTVMREERKKLGYAQDDCPAYVHLAYEGEQQRKDAMALISAADLVIAGAAPEDMLRERLRSGKLLLRYSERPFKKKASLLKRSYYAIRFRQRDLWKKNVYMLCASAYTAYDYGRMGLYRGRTYKWGYFPTIKGYDVDTLLSRKQQNKLIWCGRFLSWKHPDDAITLAKKLRDDGYDYQLEFVGTGEMEGQLRQMVEDYGLADRVRFLGAMPPDRVRSRMEEAGIYLFTSDRQEGWGAVLNEAMNSGCAVVASHAIGSVPFLIRDGENGWIYPSGDVEMLTKKVKNLLDHPQEQYRIGKAACGTILSEWNGEDAADRLLCLAGQLLAGEKTPDLYEDGPCSRAQIIDDNWFKDDGGDETDKE